MCSDDSMPCPDSIEPAMSHTEATETVEAALRRQGTTWYVYGDEVVVLAGDGGFVFDAAAFRQLLEVSIPAECEIVDDIIFERCKDLSSDPVRGARARAAIAVECDGEPAQFE